MLEIKLTDEAKKDLKDIKIFISNDNFLFAKKVVDKIFHSLGTISMFPLMGKEIDNNLREFVEPNYKYRIIYLIKEEYIEIIAIFKNKNLF